jgi:hypothetical protein
MVVMIVVMVAIWTVNMLVFVIMVVIAVRTVDVGVTVHGCSSITADLIGRYCPVPQHLPASRSFTGEHPSTENRDRSHDTRHDKRHAGRVTTSTAAPMRQRRH